MSSRKHTRPKIRLTIIRSNTIEISLFMNSSDSEEGKYSKQRAIVVVITAITVSKNSKSNRGTWKYLDKSCTLTSFPSIIANRRQIGVKKGKSGNKSDDETFKMKKIITTKSSESSWNIRSECRKIRSATSSSSISS